MRKMMAIFAHPDDEGVVAGTLASHVEQGDDVTLVCATRGEVGQISDPALATRETIGDVRTQELEAACNILGIQHLEFLDYRDSGMDGTDENNDPRAYVQANPDEAKRKIVTLIRRYQPDIVITFEPFGWYGHPDHKITSQWVTEAYPLAGDAGVYPDAGDPWQPGALYHAVIPFTKFSSMIEEAIAGGYIPEDAFEFDFPPDQQLETEAQVTHVIDIDAYFDTKQDAQSAHRTQFGEDSPFNKIPRDLMRKGWGGEHYIQVYPTPNGHKPDVPRSDLFNWL